LKKPLFNKVCIVGVGLIGGSIGMAMKKRRLARWAVGVVRRDKTAKQAVAWKAVDVATKDLKTGVRDADLVVLAAPVFQIEKDLARIAPYLKKGTVVVDVGSTKAPILAAARRCLKRNVFVGCHPMAGSEKCGIENADARLFENAVCFLTSRHTAVERFWRALGARPARVDARAHDAWVASMSHLPHLLSFALFHHAPRMPGRFALNPSAASFARLARSNPALWSDILASNRRELTAALRGVSRTLRAFDASLARPAALRRLIRAANRTASSFPE